MTHPKNTPRAPRTALYEKLVPAALAVLGLVLIAVLVVVLLWQPGA